MWWALWTLVGCDLSRFESASPDGAIPPVVGDALIWVAKTQESKVPPPIWVSGQLPSPASLSLNERLALLGRACQGDPVLLDALLAESRAADARGVDSAWDSEWIDGCQVPGPQLCRWVSERVVNGGDDALSLMWHVSGGCLDPASGAWAASAAAPSAGVVDWLANQDDQYRPVYLPHGAAAATDMLAHSGLHRRRAVQLLGSVDHPQHAQILMSLEEGRPWLYRQTDPDARTAFDAWCEAEEEPSWQCLEGFRPLDDLQATVTNTNVDLSGVLAAHPDHARAIVQAMADCVRNAAVNAEPRGDRCLRGLVGAGGEAAVIEALDRPDYDLFQHWLPIRDQWLQFQTNEALRQYLVERALIPSTTAAWDAAEPPADLLGWMIQADRGMWTPRTPSGAVRMVAGRVPEMADLVAMQRDPVWFEDDSDRRRYIELLVWVDGVRHRALVPTDDSYGRQLAGVLNGVAKARRLELRFVALDGWQALVWGPEQGLRQAHEDGLLMAAARSPVVLDTDEEGR
jgi:hypothetical protein